MKMQIYLSNINKYKNKRAGVMQVDINMLILYLFVIHWLISCPQGTIAYVPQVAWIQNETVRQNILFGKSYSKSKYKKIVDCCGLVDDFDMLPAGDKTEIGEKVWI